MINLKKQEKIYIRYESYRMNHHFEVTHTNDSFLGQ